MSRPATMSLLAMGYAYGMHDNYNIPAPLGAAGGVHPPRRKSGKTHWKKLRRTRGGKG